VRFSILFELQAMYPWTKSTFSDLYRDSLEQAVKAEEVGFDVAWCVKHHFLNQFSLSPAPEIFLTAVAGRTSRIRIGHGVVLLPFNYNHPISVAERAAVLDIIGGRLEFGTGRSSGLWEFEGFGVGPDEARDQWEYLMPRCSVPSSASAVR
jgi:alkanesulfonate monooxygenase SsuD/methylene tetrahydromethanopterin reductase-like flavin-dependent oxidoreductase (luciferase family)